MDPRMGAMSWAEAVANAVRETRSVVEDAFTLMPHQRIPDTGFVGHVLLAGRGAGKTFGAMHWLNGRCWAEDKLRCRVIAPTLGDGVASCVEGVDGLLELSHNRATFNSSSPGGACVTYPNGSKVWIVGTPTPRDVDRLRALTNMECDVFEEAAANPQLEAAFQQAALSRRRGNPRWVATTTPRPLPLIRKWIKDPDITVVRARMFDNPDLPEVYRAYAESLKGTRMYDQEVLGEVVDDVEGALWTWADIERSQVDEAPDMDVVEVGVDPAVGSGTTGIIVAGIAGGEVFVLEDASVTDVSPATWAGQVARMVEKWGALCVVVEDNQGGRMVTSTLQNAEVTVPIRTVNARVNKQARALPVAVLWEAEVQRAHFVKGLTKLVNQCLEWVPSPPGQQTKDSPDRIDALCHVVTHLLGRSLGLVEIQHGVPRAVTSLSGFRRRRIGA